MSYMDEVWNQSLTLIQQEINPVSYRTWIEPIEPVSMTKETFAFRVSNDAARTILSTRYHYMLQNALKQVSGNTYELQYLLPGEFPAEESIQASETPNEGVFNPKYTFDNFVVGSGNQFAHAACLAVAEAPAQAYNPLFLYGQSGLGKTHLLHAIGHFAMEQHPEKKVLYVRAERFTNELIEAISRNKNEEFRSRYRNVDVLMIDDIQFIAGKERTMEEFFHTFNTLHETSKQIILTSDQPPNDIPTLEDRLRSRFSWGLIADIQPPDLETRVAILIKKVKMENLALEDEVLMFIATKVESNIRTLEGALNRVLAYSRLVNRKITMELAEEALKDIIVNGGPKRLTADIIVDAVSEYYDIPKEELLGKKRSREISYPRQVAMWLCREMTDMSLPKIGEHFGGRDHTTVIFAYDKIAEELKNNPATRSAILDVKKRIQERGY